MVNKKSKSIADVNSFSKIPGGLRALFVLTAFGTAMYLLQATKGNFTGAVYFGLESTAYVSWVMGVLSSLLFLYAVWYKSRKAWGYFLAWSVFLMVINPLNSFLYTIPKGVSIGASKEFQYWFYGVFYLLFVLITYYTYSKKEYFNK